jgi:hypothetical protein
MKPNFQKNSFKVVYKIVTSVAKGTTSFIVSFLQIDVTNHVVLSRQFVSPRGTYYVNRYIIKFDYNWREKFMEAFASIYKKLE